MRLEYDFAIVGLDKIERAMASVESRFVRHNTRIARATGTSSPSAAKPKAAIATSEREALSAERRIQAARERAEQHVFRMRMRYFQQAQREEEQSARKLARERERAEASRARAAVQASRRELAERQRFRERTVGTLGNSVRNTVGGLGQIATGALGIGGGIAVAGAVSDQLSLGRRFNQLSIQSRAPGQSNPISKREVQSRVEAVAVERGIKREELTEALEVSVAKTGDLKSGMDNLERFAVLGQAFNASTADMAAAAAVLGQKFNLSGDELSDTLAKLGAQGRNAAFEFKDMASLVERLASAGQRFNFKGAEGVATLGGFTQIARTATGSSEQAATAVEATIRQLISKAGDIQSGKAFGKKVEVFEGGDPTKEARDFRSVLTDIIAASGGDQTKLQKVFGDEGIRGVTPLVTAYSKARLAAGGGKEGDAAGRQAIDAVFKQNIDAAGTYADAQKDAAEAMDDDAVRMTRATEQIAVALGQLSPLVVRMAELLAAHDKEIERAAKAVGKFAEYLFNNPIKGIGGIIAAKVTADLAGAAIGAKVRDTIVALMRGGGGGPPVPVLPPGSSPTPVVVPGKSGSPTAKGAAGGGLLGALGWAGAAFGADWLAEEAMNEGNNKTKWTGAATTVNKWWKQANPFSDDAVAAQEERHARIRRGETVGSGPSLGGEVLKSLLGNFDAVLERTGAGTLDEHFGAGTTEKLKTAATGERAQAEGGLAAALATGASRLTEGGAGLSTAATKLTIAAEKLTTAMAERSELNRSASPTEPKR